MEARCNQEGRRGARRDDELCASPGPPGGDPGELCAPPTPDLRGGDPEGCCAPPQGLQAGTEGRVATLSGSEGSVLSYPSNGASLGYAQRTWDPKAGTR